MVIRANAEPYRISPSEPLFPHLTRRGQLKIHSEEEEEDAEKEEEEEEEEKDEEQEDEEGKIWVLRRFQ